MNATIAYFTNRRNPRFKWFFDSLFRQTTPADRAALQIVVVDAALCDPDPAGIEETRLDRGPITRRAEVFDAAGQGATFDVTKLAHVAPLPCVWQGPWRQTDRDWFAASNARNTALVVADRPYLICVDDLSILAPGWFDNVRHAVTNRYVVCGAYKKLRDMKVDDGQLVSFTPNPAGVDSRWDRGESSGIVPWSGAGLFGCSFGIPLDLAIRIDGFDSYCDGQGAEDYDFGIRAERAGGRFYYNRNMLTLESEEAHTEDAPLPRTSKHVPFDRLPECLKAANPDGMMSDHVMLQGLLQDPTRILPMGTNNIMELRERWRATGMVPTPIGEAIDWRDGKPLRDSSSGNQREGMSFAAIHKAAAATVDEVEL